MENMVSRWAIDTIMARGPAETSANRNQQTANLVAMMQGAVLAS
jgi:hypothetical protein